MEERLSKEQLTKEEQEKFYFELAAFFIFFLKEKKRKNVKDYKIKNIKTLLYLIIDQTKLNLNLIEPFSHQKYIVTIVISLKVKN